MSTVIWYQGKLYADTRVICFAYVNSDGITVDERISEGSKLFRVKDTIFGVTGTLNGWDRFKESKAALRWSFKQPFEANIIGWDGKTLTIWNWRQRKVLGIYFSWLKKEIIKYNETTYIIMGSGEEFASKVIENDDTSIEDVIKYASQFDPATNDKVEILNV